MEKPDDLICPACRIFDEPGVNAALDAAYRQVNDANSIRAAAVKVLQEALTEGRRAIADAFLGDPGNARPAVRSYSWLADRIVTSALNMAIGQLHPISAPTAAERLAVMAVGGYGRAEMAPYSDVDLLFLTPYKITPWAESVIESMLYVLWDLHLKVGHASRSVAECIRLGRGDYTIRTALLEHRFIDGHQPLEGELRGKLWSELFRNTATDFIEAKLAERADRHIRQGGQRYMVEPNVKEGKGGLRDLQSLFWIDKYVHQIQDTAELVRKEVFRQEEFDAFVGAENFLLAVRCHLHLLAGRAQDQLTFDRQVEVARRMGYSDRGGRREVEHFMQDYFRHATRVGELTRIFLTALEERHVKRQPMLAGLFRRKRVAKGYRIEFNRLNIADEAEFFSDKLNILRIFEEALRTGHLIHPEAMRMISANLHIIDDGMRSNREAARIFLDLLLKHSNPERALRRMNELGVLPAFVPEFGPAVAMMQFNMYHSYTVDEHTIQTISVLAQIERGELIEELPVASQILEEGVNRRVLYVALLCHDLGKGRDEDHSILGSRIARSVAPRLGLTPKESKTVEWLVRYHLLMSDMAQKRDIADPRTVREFAKAVKSRERLDLLTVLTVCDIRGVGPKSWNDWLASLLRDLYRQTRRGLEDGLEALNRSSRGTEAKRNLKARLEGWEAGNVRREINRHYEPYWQGLHVTAHLDFANLLLGIGGDDDLRLMLTRDPDRDATRACFAMQDHPGIFSRMCGTLALVGANIKDARTFTTKDGWATAVFWIQDISGAPYETSRLPRLRGMIENTFKGKVVADEAIRSRDVIKKRERAFQVPTSITFDNEGSEIYTIIEVDTRDRPGLLFDLTRTLAANNVYISSAVVATYGEQVVDSFYVKDMFGLKFHSVPKQRTLERKLREAIKRGAERASSG